MVLPLPLADGRPREVTLNDKDGGGVFQAEGAAHTARWRAGFVCRTARRPVRLDQGPDSWDRMPGHRPSPPRRFAGGLAPPQPGLVWSCVAMTPWGHWTPFCSSFSQKALLTELTSTHCQAV